MKTIIFLFLVSQSAQVIADTGEQEHVLTVEEYDAWLAKEQAAGRWLDVNKPEAPTTEAATKPKNKAWLAIGAGLQQWAQALQRPNTTISCTSNVIGNLITTNCN